MLKQPDLKFSVLLLLVIYSNYYPNDNKIGSKYEGNLDFQKLIMVMHWKEAIDKLVAKKWLI